MTPAEKERRTIEIYDMLPTHCEELRKSRIDLRDELFEMHTGFFHWVTRRTFLDHNRYGYEDIFQEIQLQFISIWWWWRYPPKNKTPAAFSSFFLPRLKENAERSLNELSYSMYRSTLMKCAELLGLARWQDVKPEHMKYIKGETETVQLAMRMFNRNFYTAPEDHLNIRSMDSGAQGIITRYCDSPNDLTSLLISEMIYRESKLTPKEVATIADIYSIDEALLLNVLDDARKELYKRLKESADVGDSLLEDM